MTTASPVPASSATPWPSGLSLDALGSLDALRANPVLGIALLMLAAVVLAEALHRSWRLPRICGHMVMGALAGPMLLQVLDPRELASWKPLIDLAIGALLFELGTRIRPRWLFDNPWLALSCVLQALVCGGLVTAVLVAFDVPLGSAALAGAVAMSTSPAIVLAVVHETRSRGQVTERVLLMSAVNSVVAVLGIKLCGVLLASDFDTPRDEWLQALASFAWVISGSFLLGLAGGFLLDRLGVLLRGTPAMPVLQIALVISASLLAAQWRLSPLLALLVAGMTARERMRHGLTVEPHLGSAGAVLNVLLFISTGLLFSLDGAHTLLPWVLALIVARLVGSAVAVGGLARLSGLGWRQAAALTLALQPMSSLAVLLVADNFGGASNLPGVDVFGLQALLVATTFMQLTGPVWTALALRNVARESTA
ncbi:MAG: cation:proton antiporter [Burkholderiaceae bacterium]